jgi:hypothetical protein
MLMPRQRHRSEVFMAVGRYRFLGDLTDVGAHLQDSAEKEPQKEPSVANSLGREVTSNSYKGICVALPHKGRPVRIYGNSPAEFISTLQSSTLGWVNFTADVLDLDGAEVAVKLGFSDSLVSTLLKGYYAAF